MDKIFADFFAGAWDRGPLWILFGIWLYAFVKYGPPVVKGHLSVLASTQRTNDRLAAAYEKLAATVADSRQRPLPGMTGDP